MVSFDKTLNYVDALATIMFWKDHLRMTSDNNVLWVDNHMDGNESARVVPSFRSAGPLALLVFPG